MNDSAAPTCVGPDPHPRPPKTPAPAGACDAHAHVFEHFDHYPLAAARTYTPAPSPLSAYRHTLSTLGIARAVLVQPSVYGTDNRLLCDALRATGDEFRGIAVVGPDVGDGTLDDLHQAGVRGVRFNLLSGGGPQLSNAALLAPRLADRGWHLQLLADVSRFPDLPGWAAALPVEVVVDHLGHVPSRKGIDHPGFRALLELVGNGRGWVKLSGAYRITARTDPPYDDVTEMAQALIACAPDRVVWGSDWPHTCCPVAMPNDADLLDLLSVWAPDPADRSRILVDNPARLYGF